MTDTRPLETLPDETPQMQPTPRDIQRSALAELLQLSRECSAHEAELESKHRQSQSENKIKLDKALLAAQHRLEQTQKQTEMAVADALDRLETEYRNESARLRDGAANRRKVANAAFDASKNDLKKKFDHHTWLADSVLEAAEVSAKQAYRAEVEKHGAQAEQLNAIEADAANLVQKYGREPEPVEALPESADAIDESTYADTRLAVDKSLAALRGLGIARIFTGLTPILIGLLILGGVGFAVQFQRGLDKIDPKFLGTVLGATFVAILVIGIALKVLINKKIAGTYKPLRESIALARQQLEQLGRQAKAKRDADIKAATEVRNADVDAMRQRLAPVQAKASQLRENAITQAESELTAAMADLDKRAEERRQDLTRRRSAALEDAAKKTESERQRLNDRFAQDSGTSNTKFTQRRGDLQRRWREGIANIQAPIGQDTADNGSGRDWRTFERNYQPPEEFPPTIAFGSLKIDLERISAGIPRDATTELALPDQFDVPALLAFPSQASVMIETDPESREQALAALQMTMTRLLTQLPAGRARFTIIDAVGLGQSFAGFMHLADHDDQLVNGRIWTTPEQIDQRLTDLTEHMETVIQKYLRNEYQTIDEYNAQAGELAEPYRILVVADFPSGFEGESWRRLLSIARSGARCGVYTLILRDVRQQLPQDLMIEDLEMASTVIQCKRGQFTWADEIFGQFPLTLDPPPDEETLTKIAHKVGQAAKEASHVEVNFESIAPRLEDFWTQSAASELSVPIGRMGATRLQYFRCGKGVAQHSLVAGKTGSGKSTLLHALVTNLAMWYSPDEVEFYLIDFKKGVEFKTYADYGLPHARAIAVESDREFGLSVLQRIDAELGRRGDLFRRAGVQDLASYRKVEGAEVLPRVMLIIDEFQEFFTEDDRLAQEAQLLLDRLVRQGRAFGVHVFLGSQTIGGSGGLARTTIGQMGIRIALQTSEADSQLILGDSNSAARLLSRPGEAIYNDAGGAVESNSPFQVAWLSDERREKCLQAVNEKLEKVGTKKKVERPLVFEGNQPADLTLNPRLLDTVKNGKPSGPLLAWVGDPVAIKDPTSVPFRRQSGANMLIIGQADEQALGTLVASVISLSTQLPKDGGAEFVLLDGTPSDSPLAGVLLRSVQGLPQKITSVEYRDVDAEMDRLAGELARRQADPGTEHPPIFLVVNGMQRYRSLRKGDDDSFSFSMSDEPKKASPSKQLVDLIREGPNVGMHLIAWFDTLASIERTIERGLMREFDNRILFQMSSNDSSNLIDSPAANKLGFFRALAYSEEQGVMEKFRPYGLPKKGWVEQVAGQLK